MKTICQTCGYGVVTTVRAEMREGLPIGKPLSTSEQDYCLRMRAKVANVVKCSQYIRDLRN